MMSNNSKKYEKLCAAHDDWCHRILYQNANLKYWAQHYSGLVQFSLDILKFSMNPKFRSHLDVFRDKSYHLPYMNITDPSCLHFAGQIVLRILEQ